MEADDRVLDLAGSNNEKPYTTEVIIDPEVLKSSQSEDDYGTLVRIAKHGNQSHKTETKIFAREIRETYCDQSDCEFYGKHAAQGVCFETDVWDPWYNRYELIIKQSEEGLAEVEAHHSSPEELLEYLKSMYVYMQANWDNTLNECVRLRAENAKLRLKLGDYK